MPTFSNGESGLSVRTKINNAITRVDALQATSSPAFAGLTVNGNITVTGTVDGRDVSTDGTKLDGIEAGATADQTAAEIKTAYESNANTNAFTDAEQALVAGALQAANNLSDVASAPTALTNLGLTATAAELNTLDGILASTAELNILDGVTATASEINTLDGITASTAELNTLDGITASTAELNLLDGVTATTAELNILDGVTATAAELNVLDGVTGLLGWGQTWQTPTRVDSTSYQNTTGRPIQASIRARSTAGARGIEVSPDNSTWVIVGLTSASTEGRTDGVAIVIPNGWYYRINGATNAITWAELR